MGLQCFSNVSSHYIRSPSFCGSLELMVTIRQIDGRQEPIILTTIKQPSHLLVPRPPFVQLQVQERC